MATKKKSARRPSYEDGELHEPKIAELQKAVGGDQRSKFLRLIKKATKSVKG